MIEDVTKASGPGPSYPLLADIGEKLGFLSFSTVSALSGRGFRPESAQSTLAANHATR
jgi:hypothetical protein